MHKYKQKTDKFDFNWKMFVACDPLISLEPRSRQRMHTWGERMKRWRVGPATKSSNRGRTNERQSTRARTTYDPPRSWSPKSARCSSKRAAQWWHTASCASQQPPTVEGSNERRLFLWRTRRSRVRRAASVESSGGGNSFLSPLIQWIVESRRVRSSDAGFANQRRIGSTPKSVCSCKRATN